MTSGMGVVKVCRDSDPADDGLEHEDDNENAGVVDDSEDVGADGVTAEEGRDTCITL